MKRFMTWVFIIGLLAAVVIAINDVGAIIFANLRTEELTQRVTEEALRVYQSTNSRDSAGRAAVRAAEGLGIEVYGFDVRDGKMMIWTHVPPNHTIVLPYLVRYFPQLKDAVKANGQSTEPIK